MKKKFLDKFETCVTQWEIFVRAVNGVSANTTNLQFEGDLKIETFEAM